MQRVPSTLLFSQQEDAIRIRKQHLMYIILGYSLVMVCLCNYANYLLGAIGVLSRQIKKIGDVTLGDY